MAGKNKNSGSAVNRFVIEVDIHGMKVQEAKEYLENMLRNLDNSIREVVVIHGYKSGSSLQQMVRTSLKSPRIKSKIRSLNDGITTLELN